MSYCRAGGVDSDVYAYAVGGGGWVIHTGNIRDSVDNFRGYVEVTIGEFRDRMLKLRGEGYKIPDYTFERIEQEIEEYGEDWDGARE